MRDTEPIIINLIIPTECLGKGRHFEYQQCGTSIRDYYQARMIEIGSNGYFIPHPPNVDYTLLFVCF